MYLRRKIDSFLDNWYLSNDKMPLIVKGARQIGKTESIRNFAKKHYKNIIEINFVSSPQYESIFSDGFNVESIIKNISLINPSFVFEPGETLLFFDELQKYPNAATCLKFFKEDGRFDVICSGSLLGLQFNEIESISVGYKMDYNMYSLDFEEYLWAYGYSSKNIDDLYQSMINLKPLSLVEYNVFLQRFQEYMTLGGMPRIIKEFIENKTYAGTVTLQNQINLDYEEDISKYAYGLDKSKILNVYRMIPVFLGKDNKKFMISKVAHGARQREYVGITDWLEDAGIVKLCYCLNDLALPLKGNYDPNNYKIYMMDTGLLVSSLDEEAAKDLRENKNFNTYKGALYENVVAEMLVKQGYNLYFYKKDAEGIENDFFVRNARHLIPIEVKANDGEPKSLKKVVFSEKYPDIKFGIKLCNKNIGKADGYYTFPYFMTFLLKRFLQDLKDEY